MRNRIERYVLWLAPALVIQVVARYAGSGPGLELMQEPALWFLLQPADVLTIAACLSMLPALVTAVWMAVDSSGSVFVRAAWFVCGLCLSFYALIPYIGSLLLVERHDAGEKGGQA